MGGKGAGRERAGLYGTRWVMAAAAVALVLAGCDPANSVARGPRVADASAGGAPQHQDPPGIHNLHQVSADILSGSEPHGDAGWDSLKALGVRTVVSVDGARPNVEAARARDIRVIHIPIGYDGVPQEACAALTRVAREAEGPVYVHCHHGVHRGPAAAAVLWRIEEGATAQQARDYLTEAGTGKDYEGLWRDVETFVPLAPGAALPELHEVAPVESLAARMAEMDRTWDNLKACREAGWNTPADHPDVSPPHEALILSEHFTEAARLSLADQPEDLRAQMEAARKMASALQEAVVSGESVLADERMTNLGKSCQTCHKAYRN